MSRRKGVPISAAERQQRAATRLRNRRPPLVLKPTGTDQPLNVHAAVCRLFDIGTQRAFTIPYTAAHRHPWVAPALQRS